jgi:hypothetical protein
MQAAMEALLLVAELGGPTMFARIGVMRALNRHVERVFNSSRKDAHWGHRKLKGPRAVVAPTSRRLTGGFHGAEPSSIEVVGMWSLWEKGHNQK